MLSPWNKDPMKIIARITLCFLASFLSFLQGSLFAQVSTHEDNVLACKDGLESCNRAMLTDAESHDVAVSMHQRNLANCRMGEKLCDRAQLTDIETAALDVAVHQNNLSN